MKETDIEKRVKSKQNKLKKIFKGIEENKKNLVSDLIYQASFMSVKLEDLSQFIMENGIKEEYQHGENQFGYKESVESKSYNTLIKNYTNIIKQLCDMLPDDEKKKAGEDLLKFIASGKKWII